MATLFPDPIIGGVVIRDSEGVCLFPENVQNGYCPAQEFITSCEITALPSDCTARITPLQINAIQSELVALAEAFKANGFWNCGAVNNLATLFKEWETSGTLTDEEHGNLSGGDLHALVSPVAHGFMSMQDKAKFDAFEPASFYVTNVSPVFTGDPQAPTPPENDNDTSLATTEFVTRAITAIGGATAQRRNRIVNPSMQISQENGNTLGTTHGYYPVDQWGMYVSSTGVVESGRWEIPTPRGSPRVRISVTTAQASLAATSYLMLQQSIEGARITDLMWGFALAYPIVVSFGFKGPAGTYSLVIRNSPTTQSYVKNFVVTAGQAGVDTYFTVSIPGIQAGTWARNNTAGLIVNIVVAAGTTWQCPEGWQAGNFLGTAANTNGLGTLNSYEIFDVGLYLDPNATGIAPEWETPDYVQELRACQRYYQKILSYNHMWSGNTVSGVTYYANGAWFVPMRAVPTITGELGGQSGFATTVGQISGNADSYREARAAIVTQNGGYFYTTIIGNARM